MADLDKLVATWDAVDPRAAGSAAEGTDYTRPPTTPDFDEAEAAQADYLSKHPDMAGEWERIRTKRYPWHGKLLERVRASKEPRLAAADEAQAHQRNLERGYLAAGALPAGIVKGATAGLYDPLSKGERRGVDQARQHATGLESVVTEGVLGAGHLAGTLAGPYAAVSRLTSAGLGLAAGAAPGAAEALGSLAGGSTAARLGLGAAKMAGDFGAVAALEPPGEGQTRAGNVARSLPASVAFGLTGPLAGAFAGRLLENSGAGKLAESAVRAAGTAAGFGVPSAAIAAGAGANARESLREGAIGAVEGLILHAAGPRGAGEAKYDAGVKALHEDVKGARRTVAEAEASGQKERVLTARRDLAQSVQALGAHRAMRETIVARADNPDLDAIVAEHQQRAGRVTAAHGRQSEITAKLEALSVREKAIAGVMEQFPTEQANLQGDLDAVARERRALSMESELLRTQEVEHSLVGAPAKLADGTVVVVETLGKAKEGPTATVTRPDGERQTVALRDLVRADPAELKAAAEQARQLEELKAMKVSDPAQFNAIVNPPGDVGDAAWLAADHARAALGMPKLARQIGESKALVSRGTTGPPTDPGVIGTGLAGMPGSGVLNKQMTDTVGFPGRAPAGESPPPEPQDAIVARVNAALAKRNQAEGQAARDARSLGQGATQEQIDTAKKLEGPPRRGPGNRYLDKATGEALEAERIARMKRGEAGMLSWGSSRQERRALIRVHGGDIAKAEEAWRYRNVADERPALAKKFRGEVLDATLNELRDGGLRDDQVDIVARLERGEDIDAVHKAVSPHLSVPQFIAQARAANGRALVAADAVYGRRGLSAPESESQLAAYLRAWADPRLLRGDSNETAPVLNTFARLRGMGAAEKGRGNIRFGGKAFMRRMFGDPWSNLPAEVANEAFKAEARATRIAAGFTRAQKVAETKLGRVAKLTPESGSQGLSDEWFGIRKNRLKVAEETAFDAADGLRRINGGQQGTPEQVAQFIADRTAEYEQLEPGAGKDWAAAVKVYSNMWSAVRREYQRVYGRDISPNIGEGLYATHIFRDNSDNLANYRRLPRTLSDAISAKTWSRFEQGRTGAQGYVPDLVTVARQYFPGMLKKMAVDDMIRPGSPIVRTTVGDRTTLGADIGRNLERGLAGGAISDNQNGHAIIESLNQIATRTTNARLQRHLYVSIPSRSLGKVVDMAGQPLAPGQAAEGGVYHFIRSGKPVAVGDRSMWLQEAREGAKPVEVPLTRSNLSRMHTNRGGVLELAARYGQGGRLEAAERWLDCMKLADEPGNRLFNNAFTKIARDWTYQATLGGLQPKPVLNNIAGGVFMLTAHAGAEPVARALPRASAFAIGKGDAETRSVLRRMGVIEERGAILEGRGSPAGSKAKQVRNSVSELGYAGFSKAETLLRATAGLTGYDRFKGYTEQLMSTLYGTHGVPGDESLTFSRGKVYRADGTELPGGDRLASIMDGAKGRAPRQLTRPQIEHELDEMALMHGRATVAKTQFLYSVAFTPEAMQSDVGRLVFQLNQYPIRAAMNFMDAAGAERNPARVARWLAVGVAASTAAHLLHRDMSSAIGPRVGDLLGINDDETWGTPDETIAAKVTHWFADLNVPFPIPFMQGFVPPAVSALKLGAEVGHSALGFDPTNPLPDDYIGADVWSRAGQAWDEASRKERSTVVPGQWQKLREFMDSPVDEQGRHQVGYSDKPGYVTHQTPGEFASQNLLPGSRKDIYDSYGRGNARKNREGERDELSRAYRMNAVRSADPQLTEQDRGFAERQNEKLAAAHPHLANIDAGDLARFKRSAGVSREVRDLMGASLAERARGYFAWRDAEKPGPDELRESTAILFGETPKSFASRFKALAAEDRELAIRLRGAWNNTLAVAEEPVTK